VPEYYIELNDGSGADLSTPVSVEGELAVGTILLEYDRAWSVIEVDHERLFARATPVDPLSS
jgi:hypothetical protein